MYRIPGGKQVDEQGRTDCTARIPLVTRTGIINLPIPASKVEGFSGKDCLAQSSLDIGLGPARQRHPLLLSKPESYLRTPEKFVAFDARQSPRCPLVSVRAPASQRGCGYVTVEGRLAVVC